MIKFEPVINGLRAIAVLMVVFFHYDAFGLSGGFIGVDIFFVLSGYLMTKIILSEQQNNEFSIFGFYLRRLRRVFPLLVTIVFVVTIWACLYLLPYDFINFLRSMMHSLHFSSNFFFLGQLGYFDSLNESKLLLHTWTLSLEAQFYLIFPLIIICIGFLKWNVGKSLAVLALASFIFCIYYTPIEQEKSFFMLYTRLWEFLVGGLVAIRGNIFKGGYLSNIAAFIGAGLLVAGGLILDKDSLFPGYAALLPVLGSFLLILSGSRILNRILELRLFQYIGNISYSIYLWHWALYVMVLYQLNRSLSLIESIILLVVVFIFSAISYEIIEKPFRNRKGFWSNKRFLIFAFLILLAAFALKTVAKKEQGFPDRFASYISRAGEVPKYQSARQKECFRDTDGKKDAQEDFCLMGKQDAEREVVLWGDSHADQLHMVLDEVLKEKEAAGLVASFGACPATVANEGESPYEGNKLENKYKLCREFNREVLKLIGESKLMKEVIISIDWYRYKDGFMEEEITKISCLPEMKGKNLVVIGAIPKPGYVVPKQWAFEQLEQGKQIDDLKFDKEPSKFEEKAVSFESQACVNTKFLSVEEYFCEAGSCFTVENGKALYSDSSHLTYEGAKKLYQPIAKILAD